MSLDDKTHEQYSQLIEQMQALLDGHQPEIQGAVLAELTGLWLHGHEIPHALRSQLIAVHVRSIWRFTEGYDQEKAKLAQLR